MVIEKLNELTGLEWTLCTDDKYRADSGDVTYETSNFEDCFKLTVQFENCGRTGHTMPGRLSLIGVADIVNKWENLA